MGREKTHEYPPLGGVRGASTGCVTDERLRDGRKLGRGYELHYYRPVEQGLVSGFAPRRLGTEKGRNSGE